MKLFSLDETELDFGIGSHIDVRFGISNYLPYDWDRSRRKRSIATGIVGPSDLLNILADWLISSSNGVKSDGPSNINLYPDFPGFNDESPFRTSIVIEDVFKRRLNVKELSSVMQIKDYNALITELVSLYLLEIKYLHEKNVDVILCCRPDNLNEVLAGLDKNEETLYDFHDMLKARSMEEGIPIQVIRPDTYGVKSKREKNEESTRGLQEPATRAWNLFSALYYKAGGTPWRIPTNALRPTTCYLGISFYRSLDKSSIQTSIAQVFDELGDGIILRGAKAVSKVDRQPHLTEDQASELIEQCLLRYKSEHHNFPGRVVVHKSSRFSLDEQSGIIAALESKGIDLYDLVSTRSSFVRLFRNAYFPPLRGTLAEFEEKMFLYTRGSVPFYKLYPGMHVPHSLELVIASSTSSRQEIANDVLSLTKLNWNNTRFDSLEPITIRGAKQVGTILKYANSTTIAPRYSFYM